MKYLLKSSDFTFDSDSKKFVLDLSNKLRTNRALVLRNVGFQLRTDMPSPHVLLLCSNLAELSSKTVYQTASSHRFDDVIAVLFEGNSGRFVLRKELKIHIEDKDIPPIEFWIRTEAGDLVSCCVGDALPGESPPIERSQVTSISEMRLFMPMDINQNTAFESMLY